MCHKFVLRLEKPSDTGHGGKLSLVARQVQKKKKKVRSKNSASLSTCVTVLLIDIELEEIFLKSKNETSMAVNGP